MSTQSVLCSVCTEFLLQEYREENTIHYNNKVTKIVLEHSHCPLCGVQDTKEQTLRNNQKTNDWRKSMERPWKKFRNVNTEKGKKWLLKKNLHGLRKSKKRKSMKICGQTGLRGDLRELMNILSCGFKPYRDAEYTLVCLVIIMITVWRCE
jgi:hypothetical protein